MSIGQVASNAYSAQASAAPTGAASKVNGDLRSVLRDLQPGAATTAPATAGTGSLSTDLQSFFTDLQQAGGSHQGHHHHPHAGSRSPEASDGPLQPAGNSNASSTSGGDLLGSVLKSLQAYSPQSAAVSALSAVS